LKDKLDVKIEVSGFIGDYSIISESEGFKSYLKWLKAELDEGIRHFCITEWFKQYKRLRGLNNARRKEE